MATDEADSDNKFSPEDYGEEDKENNEADVEFEFEMKSESDSEISAAAGLPSSGRAGRARHGATGTRAEPGLLASSRFLGARRRTCILGNSRRGACCDKASPGPYSWHDSIPHIIYY